MLLRRFAAGAAVAAAVVGFGAAPAFAHDCFNPTKDAHAPSAGVNYTIVGFDTNTGAPIFQQTGPGQGIGGFVAIAPGVFGNPTTVYLHSIGNSQSLEEVGGPGSHLGSHGCDGKGIDYVDVCFGP